MPQSIFQHKIINAGMLIFTGPCFLFALTNNCDNLLQVCMLLMLVPSCALKQIDLHSRHTVGADKTAGSTKAYTFACVLQRTLTDEQCAAIGHAREDKIDLLTATPEEVSHVVILCSYLPFRHTPCTISVSAMPTYGMSAMRCLGHSQCAVHAMQCLSCDGLASGAGLIWLCVRVLCCNFDRAAVCC